LHKRKQMLWFGPRLERERLASRFARFYTDGGGDGGAGAGGSGSTGGSGSGGAGGAAGSGPTLEQLQTELAQLRSAGAATAKERDELSTKLKQIEDAQLTETERLKKQAEESAGKVSAAEQKLRDTLTRLEIERAARKLSIVDEDAAFRLLDASKIEFDKDGQPTNVSSLLEALVKAKPYLVEASGGGGSGGGASNPGRGRGAGELTRADLAKMTPAQIAALPQDKVLAAMAA
jgi:hypothetical protein